jgi:hypothetical protein
VRLSRKRPSMLQQLPPSLSNRSQPPFSQKTFKYLSKCFAVEFVCGGRRKGKERKTGEKGSF